MTVESRALSLCRMSLSRHTIELLELLHISVKREYSHSRVLQQKKSVLWLMKFKGPMPYPFSDLYISFFILQSIKAAMQLTVKKKSIDLCKTAYLVAQF